MLSLISSGANIIVIDDHNEQSEFPPRRKISKDELLLAGVNSYENSLGELERVLQETQQMLQAEAQERERLLLLSVSDHRYFICSLVKNLCTSMELS